MALERVFEYPRTGEDLVHSRRGHGKEARNVAMYLSRRLRGDRLQEIGNEFGLGKYSSVSSVVQRVKVLMERDKILRERVDHLISMIIKSQEQT